MFGDAAFLRGWALRLSNARAMVCLLALAASGCGQKDVIPVSGKVTHKDGTPVTGGMVIFEPLGQKVSARGEIQSNGTFQLGTRTNNDGAMEGEYKVLISPPPVLEEGKRVRSPIAAKYQSLESTPLKFAVSRDRNKNKFNIEIE